MNLSEELKDKKKLSLVVVLFVFLIFLVNLLTSTTQDVIRPLAQEAHDQKNEGPLPERVINIENFYHLPMKEIAAELGVGISESGNIKFENEQYKLLIESEDGKTSTYVQVGVKSLGTCSTNMVPEVVNMVVNSVSLDYLKIGNPTNNYNPEIGAIEFCEYPSEIFGVGVSCLYDGGYYEVSLSPRKYCIDN
jgi:hypothetical protein